MNKCNVIVAVMLSIMISACGSDNDKSPPSGGTPPVDIPPVEKPPTDSDIVNISVAANTALTDDKRRHLLPVGYPAKFTATAHYQNGEEQILEDEKVDWSTHLPVFEIDNSGVIWGEEVTHEDIRITATFGDLSSEVALLRVVDNTPSSDLVITGTHELLVNTPANYSASIHFGPKIQLDLTAFTEWEVDTSTAQIDTQGVLTAEVEGSLVVSGTYDDLSQSIDVKVYDLDRITLSISSPLGELVHVGSEIQLMALATLTNEQIDVTERVMWDFSACGAAISEGETQKGLIVFNEVAECEIFVQLVDITESLVLSSGTIDTQSLDYQCFDASGSSAVHLWNALDCKTELTTEFTTIAGQQPPHVVDITDATRFHSDNDDLVTFSSDKHAQLLRGELAKPGDTTGTRAIYKDLSAFIDITIGFPNDAIVIDDSEAEILQGGKLKLIALSESVDVSSSVDWYVDHSSFTVSSNGTVIASNDANVGDTAWVTATMPEALGISTDTILITVTAVEMCNKGNLHNVPNCLEIITGGGKSFTSPPKAALSERLGIPGATTDGHGFSVYELDQAKRWCTKLDAIAFNGLAWQLASPNEMGTLIWGDVKHWPDYINIRTGSGDDHLNLFGPVFWVDNGDARRDIVTIGPNSNGDYPGYPDDNRVGIKFDSVGPSVTRYIDLYATCTGTAQ